MKSKLVRNKIPDIIKASGRTPKTFQIGSDSRLPILGEKAVEESQELYEAICNFNGREEIVDEMADLLEVLYQTAEELGISFSKVQAARHTKAIQRGSFSAGIMLVGIDESE